jgi:hypothetical protein
MTNETADRHQRRMGTQRWASYRCVMDYLPDSSYSGAEGTVRGGGVGALLAIAVVLVLAAASAGLLAAGSFLVAGA